MHTLMALDHPNIIKLYDVIDHPKSLIFVFEYAECGDLQQFMQTNKKPLDENTCKAYFLEILSGLSYAHNRHFVHRDMKLANILMMNSDIVKIADFGLSSVFTPGKELKSKVYFIYLVWIF